MMTPGLLSLAADLWITATGSLTLAVFSAIFAAIGYGVHEIRKVRNRIHELHIEHQALRQDLEQELAILGLGDGSPLDPSPEEPRVEGGGEANRDTRDRHPDDSDESEGD